MTIESTISKITYAGNGSTRLWPLPFACAQPEHIRLVLTDSQGKETELASGWQAEMDENGSTSIRYPLSGQALPAGNKLTICRQTPRTQIVDLINTGAFEPELLEKDGFDRAVMMIQELQEGLDRAVKVPLSSDQNPEALAEELFQAHTEALSAAGKAGQSEAAARSYAAQTAEIKAAALREVREESDRQAGRLDGLANSHILTFEREVERAHEEADRAEEAANKTVDITTLAQGAENLEATWQQAGAVAAGEELILPLHYIVGRHMLRLSWGGAQLYPVNANGEGQFAEVGEPESISNRVRLLFDLPAGVQLNMWVIASNVARGVKEAEAAARAAAAEAAGSALESAGYALAAEADATTAREQADAAGGFAQSAEDDTEKAKQAAACAKKSACRAALAASLSGLGGLFTIKNVELVHHAPQGFYIADSTLLVPALAALPLLSLNRLEDLPDFDCYAILGGNTQNSGIFWPPQGKNNCSCSCSCNNGNGSGGSGGNGGSSSSLASRLCMACAAGKEKEVVCKP